RNAIDLETRQLLSDAFERAGDDPEVRVVVLTGSGGSFSAGVDLGTGASGETGHVMMARSEPLAAPVDRCQKPVIAAVDGPAVGGGFELALAADIRVASRRSFFALPEVRIGSLPGSGGTQRLFSAVPSAIAWKLLLTGDRLSAERAYEVGLVSDLYDEDEFTDRVRELAMTVATSAPLSLRAVKVAGRAGVAGDRSGLELERTLWAFLSTTEDRDEGRAAFRDKRDPEFKGR
ncbi:MAG: enoyl-CoA hydratase/isomerase family protein, partial [Acidimicrobiia bacterium]